MVKIAQKNADHTITIGSPTGYLPGLMQSTRKDGPYVGVGGSFGYLGFAKTWYDHGQFGEFDYRGMDAFDVSPQMYGVVNGRAYAFYQKDSTFPDSFTVGLKFSQNIDAQTTDYSLTMTTRAFTDILGTGVPLTWEVRFVTADDNAFYFTGSHLSGGSGWGTIRMPFDGGTITYSAIFLGDVVNPSIFINNSKTSLASRSNGSNSFTTMLQEGTVLYGPRTIQVYDWGTGDLNWVKEEFQLSDPVDQAFLTTGLQADFGSQMDSVGIYQNSYGWVISVYGYTSGSVLMKAWFQISQDMTQYRRIDIVSLNPSDQYYLDEFAGYAMYTDDGHIVVPFPASLAGWLGSPTFDAPDFPIPVTGDVQIRTWTGTLDGHDFYVLRLGTQDTLVYDTYSKQWYDWESADQPIWSVNAGYNWLGSRGKGYESSIVVGDDETGQLYFLDPTQAYDEGNDDLSHYFERVAMAQTLMQGRKTAPCHVIYLNGDNEATTARPVKLETSDDNGKTFFDHGDITAEIGNYEQEFSWRSLGLIRCPGRLFKITDDGAFTRIDNLEVNDNG